MDDIFDKIEEVRNRVTELHGTPQSLKIDFDSVFAKLESGETVASIVDFYSHRWNNTNRFEDGAGENNLNGNDTIDLTTLEEDLTNNNEPNNNIEEEDLENTWRLDEGSNESSVEFYKKVTEPGADPETDEVLRLLTQTEEEEEQEQEQQVGQGQCLEVVLGEDPVQRKLHEDTRTVLRLIGDSLDKSHDEVYLYLEHHLDDPLRVQKVTDELLGLNQPDDRPDSPLPQAPPSPLLQYKGKGKGKGKKTRKAEEETIDVVDDKAMPGAGNAVCPNQQQQLSSAAVDAGSYLGARAISPDSPDYISSSPDLSSVESVTEVDGGVSAVLSRAAILKREEPVYVNSDTDSDTPSKATVAEAVGGVGAVNIGQKLLLKRAGSNVGSEPSCKVRKIASGGGGSAGRRPPPQTEIRDEHLHGPFNFSDHRIGRTKGVKRSRNLPTQQLEQVVEEVEQVPRKQSRDLLADVSIDDPAVTIEPAAAVVEGAAAAPAAAAGLTEGQAALFTSLTEMFPNTNRDYITLRVPDLAGKPAATNRFIEELMRDPNPPQNWQQMFAVPVQDPEVQVIEAPPAPAPSPPIPMVDDAPLPNNLLNDTDNARNGAYDEAVNNFVVPDPIEEVVAVVVPGAGAPTATGPDPPHKVEEDQVDGVQVLEGGEGQQQQQQASQEMDPHTAWIEEKASDMRIIFSLFCPDWIRETVAQIPLSNPDLPFQSQLQEMNQAFHQKVEEVCCMTEEMKKEIPTLADYMRKKKEQEELERWTGQFTPKMMIDLYSGDPVTYFYDKKRKPPPGDSYKEHSLIGLKADFRFHSLEEITKAFRKANCLYAPAHKILKGCRPSRKTRRPLTELKAPSSGPCIGYLKEKKFCELEQSIIEFKEKTDKEKQAKIEFARAANLLVECLCCGSDDIIDEETISCKSGHQFCMECVQRHTDVKIGDGKTIIDCLGHCSEEIGWQQLQRALAPNTLSKLLQKRQMEEVSSAGLEGIVTCPFCPYQTIMEDENDKVLACRNPECGRDSCRLCKEPSHIPLRCEEVETSNEEKHRKKVEEQLTQALIRSCVKCEVKYLKEDGCNKMTCPKCGTRMCYLCKVQVEDYSHFYGQGGNPTKEKTCPLWSDNKFIHEQAVAEAAKKAREEMASNNIQLKFDPTKDIKEPLAGSSRPVGHPPDVAVMFGPREEILRQQRYIEGIIRNGGNHHNPVAAAPGAGNMFGGGAHIPVPHPFHNPMANYHIDYNLHQAAAAPYADVQNMMVRMREILRMREEQREQHRRVRQAELQALREFGNHPWVPAQQQQQAPQQQQLVEAGVAQRHHQQHHPLPALGGGAGGMVPPQPPHVQAPANNAAIVMAPGRQPIQQLQPAQQPANPQPPAGPQQIINHYHYPNGIPPMHPHHPHRGIYHHHPVVAPAPPPAHDAGAARHQRVTAAAAAATRAAPCPIRVLNHGPHHLVNQRSQPGAHAVLPPAAVAIRDRVRPARRLPPDARLFGQGVGATGAARVVFAEDEGLEGEVNVERVPNKYGKK